MPYFLVLHLNFVPVCDRFESTVTAQFYGHTHKDEFAVFYEEDRATNIAFVTPSITTFTGAYKPII